MKKRNAPQTFVSGPAAHDRHVQTVVDQGFSNRGGDVFHQMQLHVWKLGYAFRQDTADEQRAHRWGKAEPHESSRPPHHGSDLVSKFLGHPEEFLAALHHDRTRLGKFYSPPMPRQKTVAKILFEELNSPGQGRLRQTK
jgi:hypothetical protein